MRGNGDFATGGTLKSFGGVIDEINDNAAEKKPVGADSGEILLQGGFEMDAVETTGEDFESFVNGGVRICGQELGSGEANELGEFIDERRECGNFTDDQAGTFLGERGKLLIGGWVGLSGASFEVMEDALRGELDGRKGILDLVSDAARDLLPSRGFLRAKDFGKVVEDENVTGIGAAGTERADRNSEME